jgi:tetratricopeptide (TPR) repeat protein
MGDLHKALALHPSADARYTLLCMRGILYFHQKELDQAEADFRAALALKPGQYNAYQNLAQVALVRGDFAKAAEWLAATLERNPPTQVLADYHSARARALLGVRKFEEALQECTTAMELAPRQTAAVELQGRALLALGRAEQAAQAFDAYLHQGGAKTTDVYRGRGQARMKLGKYPEAIEDYTRALELAPDADIYQHRGWAHFFADAWKLALRDFTSAIALDPAQSDSWTGRGLANVMLGQSNEAVSDAEAALALGPRSPEMMHNIACIFAQATLHVPENQPMRAADYRRRAVAALRAALALVPADRRHTFWQEKVLPDAALTPLRNDGEFQQLVREYAKERVLNSRDDIPGS